MLYIDDEEWNGMCDEECDECEGPCWLGECMFSDDPEENKPKED